MNAPGLPRRWQSGLVLQLVCVSWCSIRFTLFRLCGALVYGRVQPCEWCMGVGGPSNPKLRGPVFISDVSVEGVEGF